MKKLMLLLFGVLILACGSLSAQDDYPKAEVFGGFSVLNTDMSGLWQDRFSFYGFQANGAFNLNENFGIEADFGGQFKSEQDITVHSYEYLFGPRFAVRQERTTLFVHALFGGTTLGAEGHNTNGFAMGFGGGFDVAVHDRIAIRVVQFDWIPARFTENGEGSMWIKDTVRFGFGIVIK
jgi:hypothetical protein